MSEIPKVVDAHLSSENILSSAGRFPEDSHHRHCWRTGLPYSHEPAKQFTAWLVSPSQQIPPYCS